MLGDAKMIIERTDLTDCYVAILECSSVNENVGDMWSETHICEGATSIDELMEWKEKHDCGYRLSITKAT